jgi:hypothetical protein
MKMCQEEMGIDHGLLRIILSWTYANCSVKAFGDILVRLDAVIPNGRHKLESRLKIIIVMLHFSLLQRNPMVSLTNIIPNK